MFFKGMEEDGGRGKRGGRAYAERRARGMVEVEAAGFDHSDNAGASESGMATAESGTVPPNPGGRLGIEAGYFGLDSQ